MIDRTPRPAITGVPVPEREEVRHPGGLLGTSTPLEAVRRPTAYEEAIAEVVAAVSSYVGAEVTIHLLVTPVRPTYRVAVAGVPGSVDVTISDALAARATGIRDVWQTLADAARRHRFAHTPDVEDHIERGSE